MKYDLHIHTYYSSKCSAMSPEKAIEKAKKRGLDGIAITDHNTIAGALEAKRLNKDKNFEVIIGEEVSTDRGHIVCLYVKKEIKPGKRGEVIKEAKKQGCIVIAAHPFDKLRNNCRGRIPEGIDAVEAKNGRTTIPLFNIKSRNYAKRTGIAMVGGSDSHFPVEVGRVYTEFDKDLRSAIKGRTTKARGTTIFGYFGIASTTLMRFLRRFGICKPHV